MLLEVKVKGKTKEISFCDFCKKSRAPKLLIKTGRNRYDIDSDSFGLEVICETCLDYLNGK